MADDGLINFRTVSVIPGNHIVNYAYDANSQVEYIGYAEQGVATSASKWVIRKFSYSSGLLQNERIAKNVAWDSRTTVSYS